MKNIKNNSRLVYKQDSNAVRIYLYIQGTYEERNRNLRECVRYAWLPPTKEDGQIIENALESGHKVILCGVMNRKVVASFICNGFFKSKTAEVGKIHKIPHWFFNVGEEILLHSTESSYTFRPRYSFAVERGAKVLAEVVM